VWTSHIRTKQVEYNKLGVAISPELSRRVYTEHEEIQARIEAGDVVGAAPADANGAPKKKKKKAAAPGAPKENGKLAGGQKQQQQNKQQQPKKQVNKGPEVKRPTSEAELVALIKEIIDQSPQRFVHVPAIGDRIQALTKVAWNKTFKPTFGSLKEFVGKRSSDFHLDETLERVFLAKDWQHISAEKAAVAADTNAKKAAKKERTKASHDAASSSAKVAEEGQSSATKVIAVVGLLAFLGIGTVFVVSSLK